LNSKQNWKTTPKTSRKLKTTKKLEKFQKTKNTSRKRKRPIKPKRTIKPKKHFSGSLGEAPQLPEESRIYVFFVFLCSFWFYCFYGLLEFFLVF